MHCAREIASNVYWIGGSDRKMERFENFIPLPYGMTYNSYAILDDKVAVLDTSDSTVSKQFLENLEFVLAGRPVDYLVVNHVEPDHGADISTLCRMYPHMKIIGNAKTFQMLSQFFSDDMTARFQEVKEKDEISLGSHTLRFYLAPMVHWPEVMFTYETSKKILFSADAFGAFGAFSGDIFSDELDYDAFFLGEARRYYANIVGKYGQQVQMALAKLSGEEIHMLCSLHGPLWRKNLDVILDKYNHWSQWKPEQKGVVIACGSMYGNTNNAAQMLATRLAELGVENIQMYDISKTHLSFVVADIYRYSHLVLAAPTYNMGLYMPMETLLSDIALMNLQNRKVAIIGNGSWAPQSPTLMRQKIESMKNMALLAEPVVIHSSVKPEQEQQLMALADTIAASLKAE